MTTVVAVSANDKHHFMVPFPRNENFIGQSHIAMWIEDDRQKRIANGKPEHPGHLRLALCGLGGIGKTQDVLSFIYQYENKRSVFWIHAGSITQFEADCQKLASVAKIPGHDDTEQHSGSIVKQWLESPESGEWILVLDNADNMLDFYPTALESTASDESNTVSAAHDGIAKFIPRGSKGTIIVTTRDLEVARNIASRNVIIKQEMTPEQAMELFDHHYPNAEEAADDSRTSLQRLLEVLQYLPLTIVQAAVYLDLNRTFSISEYIKIFESKKESTKLRRLLSKPHDNIWRDNGGHAETILTTFSISFRQIQEQSKLADSFLRFMACINRKAIPLDLLIKIHSDGIKDKQVISEALDRLVNFSILQRVNIDFGSGKAYEIHSLVHLVLQTYLDSGEMDTALNEASIILAEISPDSGYENWAEWRVCLPHVMTLLENLKEDSEASADLCMKVALYLAEALRRFPESLELYERARTLYADSFGEESDDTLRALYALGNIFLAVGLWKEAQETLEKVLGVWRCTLGYEHQDTLECMSSLAIAYFELGGRLKEVQELMEKILEVRRCTLGEEHPETLVMMCNLAVIYTDLGGRLQEVQELQEKVLEVRRRTLGEEDPKTLGSMEGLAVTYSNLGGRLRDAQKLKEKVVEVRRRTLGEEHPDTLHSMAGLAVIYGDLGGRLQDVQELQEKVLEVQRRTLGEDHQDVLKSMQRLAVTYDKLGGRLEEVKELQEKVLEARRRTLGEEYPDTLRSMQYLAITYKKLGGRLREVQELQEKVLEVRRRTLGEEHADTLRSMQDLAETYQELDGSQKDGEGLEEEVPPARCG
ncbi:P-loop containing nucleoside triphosphate hydrolase protein [Pyronema omphalodes]|nr:P-loop containing nucleoside triphosphate hydrolase protein [Pyronema omphalodes]